MPDNTVIVTTAYDTLLVDNVSDIRDIAELLRKEDGVITDLTEYVGAPSETDGWKNSTFFDTKYTFNYAILTHGRTSQVFSVVKWKDFSEGEQLQVMFKDGTGVWTSFVNVSLIYTENPGMEEIIARAFSGDIQNTSGLVKIYN